ncbi:MAG: aldehyde dehydrogenase family protein [Myxococcota bacterium]|nr:aldehyde dehydrogenase family protein [Myxococcota bacterium]MDW8361160.1 aldehyde dehydrogenase family protein [Myxococcales bacterium]
MTDPVGAPGDEPLIDGGYIHGRAPADGASLEAVEITPLDSLGELVRRVRRAAQEHAARDIDERIRRLRALQNAVMARGEALVRAITTETGKPEAEAWLHEVVPTADLGAYWCREGPALLAVHEVDLDAFAYPGKRAVVERVPRGVIGLITPWNFPAALPLRTLFPALLAGNGVVWKPSEHVPRTAAIIHRAIVEVYGPDLVVLVQGGPEAGAAVVEAGLDAIVFTGSVATGRRVAEACARALVPVSLELGGKDAAVVLEDADVERTARGLLWGALANSGQNCAAIERVVVVESIAPKLEARLRELLSVLEPGRDYGPLTTAAQRDLVLRHLQQAREAGARVEGGEALERPGLWMRPALVTETPVDCGLWQEETFGPVLALRRVPDEPAAIELANASRYGLTASVWTRNLERGERVARALRAGVVVVNNHGFTGAIPSLPWTGVGESGFGVTNSVHALEVLCRPRALVVDARRARRELWWHPYTPALVRIGRAMNVLRRPRSGLVARVRSLFALIAAFLARWRLPRASDRGDRAG